jgi:DNA invertase Pin-like site-specific DNA recombinase
MDCVAYLRVSTGKQEASGLGLEAQLEYIQRAAEQNGWNIVATYSEAVSGGIAPQDRPECSRALAHGLPLVVAKLDRLSRDVEHIAGLMKRTAFKVATMPHAQPVELHIWAALSQSEKDFIGQRTRDALKALQARADSGDEVSIQKIANRTAAMERGRATVSVDAATAAKAAKITQHRTNILPHVQACLYMGLNTFDAVAQCLNSKGQKTSRDGEWSATTVRRLMISLDLSFK